MDQPPSQSAVTQPAIPTELVDPSLVPDHALAMEEPVEPAVVPVASEARVSSIDVLRGAALLGILLINITVFGLPFQAYNDPTIAGGDTGLNFAVYVVNSILFEGKMRALFSMLFGAGIILLTTRAERRGRQADIADIYTRRNLWLIVFGVLHAYLLWPGDILFNYGVVGLILFPFRKLGPKTLFVLGALALATQVPKCMLVQHRWEILRNRAAQADAAAKLGRELTEDERTAQEEWQNKLNEFKPTAQQVADEIRTRRGDYWSSLRINKEAAIRFETKTFYLWFFWDTAGMMLIGMALMKLGVFSAQLSRRAYALMVLVGYAIGIPLGVVAVWLAVHDNWDPVASWTNFGVSYDVRRLATCLGHVGALLLLLKYGFFPGAMARLAAVGRMALTAYLGTTVICIVIFNGYGLGLFGSLERYQLYIVVLGIWGFWLIFCPSWLHFYRFGPMEWLWRSLTYWKSQPMRAADEAPLQATAA